METTSSVHQHKRTQESLLAPLERAVLHALARSMPHRINSDHLTLLGASGMVLASLFYYLAGSNPQYLHLASLAIVLNWFGDSLDGTLARFRQRLRPRYGYYIDHILDSLGAALLVAGLVMGHFMSLLPAALFLTVYFLLNIHIYLATTATGEFKISFGLLGPTELRIGLILGNFFLARSTTVVVADRAFLLFDLGAIIGSVLLTVILTVSALRLGRRLYLLET